MNDTGLMEMFLAAVLGLVLAVGVSGCSKAQIDRDNRWIDAAGYANGKTFRDRYGCAFTVEQHGNAERFVTLEFNITYSDPETCSMVAGNVMPLEEPKVER